MRDIGIHIRIIDTLTQAIEQALELGITTFQCFLLHQQTGMYLSFDSQDLRNFQQLRKNMKRLYIHASYWINLSGKNAEQSLALLRKEIYVAKQLEATHIIMHPGSANGMQTKQEGIDSLVRALNMLLVHEHGIKIVLENTAFGGNSIGSDLHDFITINQKLEFPDRISYCLDTAHAFAYGYKIHETEGLEEFFSTVQQSMGFNAIQVIHLNNTNEVLGSKRDKHDLLDKGLIPLESFQNIVRSPQLEHSDIILELPLVAQDQLAEILAMVRNWKIGQE